MTSHVCAHGRYVADGEVCSECGPPVAQEETPTDLLDGLRNGAWLAGQDFPPLRYHLPGVIPEGLTLVVGPPKIGKSWFVLALALAAAQDQGRALGLAVEQRPVLYLALEDGDRRLKDRCHTLGTHDIPEAFEYLTRIQPMSVLATIDAWLERHPDTATEPLVILDTLGKVMPPALVGESSYGRDYRVGTALKRIVDDRPGAALVINHHDRKAESDDFVDRVSGTNGLAGSADTIVVLARKRTDSDGLLMVTGRDVAEGEYGVSFDGQKGIWSLNGGDLGAAARNAQQHRAGDGLDARARDVIAYVNQHPDGVRYADVKERLGDTEARYLQRLAEGNRIARLDRGLYGPLPVPLSVVSGVSGSEKETGQTDTTDTPTAGEGML